jgi:hypothetical protein
MKMGVQPSAQNSVSESFWTIIVVTALVKEDERGGVLFYHECFFDFVFHFVSDGKIKRVCVKFCVKLSKSDIKTLEIPCEAFGEHSLS